jgi:hypothetical protein
MTHLGTHNLTLTFHPLFRSTSSSTSYPMLNPTTRLRKTLSAQLSRWAEEVEISLSTVTISRTTVMTMRKSSP